MPRLLRQFIAFLTGEALTHIANVVVLAILLRRVGRAGFGTFSLAQGWALMLMPLVLMGMVFAAVPAVAAEPQRARAVRATVLRLRLLVALLVSLPLALVATGLHQRGDAALARVMWAYIAVLFVQAWQFDYLCVALDRAPVMALGRSLAAGLFLALVALLIWPMTPLWTIPLLYAGALTCGIGFQAWRLHPLPGTGAEPALPMRELFALALPIVLAQASQMGYYLVDQQYLGLVFDYDRAVVGDYAAMSKLMQVGVVPMIALVLVLAPRYARAWKEQNWRILRAIEFRSIAAFIALGLIGAALLGSLGPWFLERLAQKELPLTRELRWYFAACYLLIGLHSGFSALLPFLGAGRGYLVCNALALLVVLLAVPLGIHLLGARGAVCGLACGLVVLMLSAMWVYVDRRRRLRAAAGTVPA